MVNNINNKPQMPNDFRSESSIPPVNNNAQRPLNATVEKISGIINEKSHTSHFQFNGSPLQGIFFFYSVASHVQRNRSHYGASKVPLLNPYYTYSTPSKENMGFFEKCFLRPVDKKIETVNGLPLEVTYHNRTGENARVEITGGPQELVGFSTTPTKNDSKGNWKKQGIAEIESHVKKTLPNPAEIPIVGADQIPSSAKISVEPLPGEKYYRKIIDDDALESCIKSGEVKLLPSPKKEDVKKLPPPKKEDVKRLPSPKKEDVKQLPPPVMNELKRLPRPEKIDAKYLLSPEKKPLLPMLLKSNTDTNAPRGQGLEQIPKNEKSPIQPQLETPKQTGSQQNSKPKDYAKEKFRKIQEKAPISACNTLGLNIADGVVEILQEVSDGHLSTDKVTKIGGKVILETGKKVITDQAFNTGYDLVKDGATKALNTDTAKKAVTFIAENITDKIPENIPIPDFGHILIGIQVVNVLNNSLHEPTFEQGAKRIAKDGTDLAFSAGCSYVGAAIGGALGSAVPILGTYGGVIIGSTCGRGAYHVTHWAKDRTIMWIYPESSS